MSNFKVLMFLLLFGPNLLTAGEDGNNDRNPLSSLTPSQILNSQNSEEKVELPFVSTAENENEEEVHNNRITSVSIAEHQPLSMENNSRDNHSNNEGPGVLGVENHPRYLLNTKCSLFLLGLNILPPLLAGLSGQSRSLAKASCVVDSAYTIMFTIISLYTKDWRFSSQPFLLAFADYYAYLYQEETIPFQRKVNFGLTCAFFWINQILLGLTLLMERNEINEL